MGYIYINACKNAYLSFSNDKESVSFLALTNNVLSFVKIILKKIET